MILSEYQRRWDEIRMYFFIQDTFNINKNTTDLMHITDAVCDIGNVDKGKIRTVIMKMLNDPYFIPYKAEIYVLAKRMQYPMTRVARRMGTTQQAANQNALRNLKNYEPYPRYEIDENQEMHKFLDTYEELRKVGI
jgi:hypothetical protein